MLYPFNNPWAEREEICLFIILDQQIFDLENHIFRWNFSKQSNINKNKNGVTWKSNKSRLEYVDEHILWFDIHDNLDYLWHMKFVEIKLSTILMILQKTLYYPSEMMG